MNPPNLEWLRRFGEASDSGVFDDEFGSACTRLMGLGVADEQVFEFINSRLARFERQKARGQISPYLAPRLASGDLMLGNDERGTRVTISRNSLTEHGLGIASSGSGKSTLLLFLLLQLIAQIEGSWCVDLRKRDLRKLLPLVARKGVDLVVASLSRVRLNPLQIESPNPRQAVPRRLRSVATSLHLTPPAYREFDAVCWSLYDEFGVLERTGTRSPTLFDVYERIKRSESAHAQVKAGLLDRIRSVLIALGPDVLGWRRGWRAEDLARRHIVFEGLGVTEANAMLLVEPLIESRLSTALDAGLSNRSLELLVVLEDAQTLLSSRETSDLRVMDEFMGLVRGAGIGIMPWAQSAHGLSPHLLANTATKWIGRTGHARDTAMLGAAMGLTAEQIRWATHNLTPGRFICQTGDAAWRKPFVLQVPNMHLSIQVTDEDAERSMKPLLDLPVEFAEEFRNWTPIERVEAQPPKTKPSPTTADSPSPARESQTLTENETKLLRAIDSAPGTPMSRLHTAASISRRLLYRLRDELIERGLVRTSQLSTSARGRPAVILVLTEAGRRALGDV